MNNVGSSPAAPLNRTGRPAAPPTDGGANTPVSLLSPAQEQALSYPSDPDLNFDTFCRDGFTNELVGPTGYLTQGWLPEDSYRQGPVILLREEAISPEGVAWGEDNLGLQPDAQVIGVRDTQGGSDSYFICQPDPDDPHAPPRFFTVCIESGQHDHRYEIFVSAPLEWEDFLDQLG
jgi:hypothetical protein